MSAPLPIYSAHVQFNAIGVNVKARNAREARRKVRAKVAKLKAARLIDRGNLFIERHDS